MKPQLTPELKERFLAQYWGQRVFFVNDSVNEIYDIDSNFQDAHECEKEFIYALLRPISSLTDDEAIEVAISSLMPITFKTACIRRFDHPNHKSMSTITVLLDTDNLEVLINQESAYISISANGKKMGIFNPAGYIQKLLSLGIAIPFMGHSVGDLVNAGWVKLKES